MFNSKLNSKNISIWQHISFILFEVMTVSTIFVLILQLIDIQFNITHSGTFMFDYLDMYSRIHSFMLFDFGMSFSSMIPECVGFNIIRTIIDVLLCLVFGYFSTYVYKPKAKIILGIWLIPLFVELLFSFAFMFSDWHFVLVFVSRAFMIFCVFMSLRYMNRNYEYYDI